MTREETVTHKDTGFKLNIKAKRGTGTRDQDTVSITGNFESMEGVKYAREEMIEVLERYADAVRNVQPDTEDDS